MIIETKNSSYEIQGNLIRKISEGDGPMGEDFVEFDTYVFPPKVGGRLMVIIGRNTLRTSVIKAIIADSQNEGD